MGLFNSKQNKDENVAECMCHAKPNIFTVQYFTETKFSTGIVLHIGFSQIHFIRFKTFPCISNFPTTFIKNECLTLSQSTEII